MKPFLVNLNHSFPKTKNLHIIARSFYDKNSASQKDYQEAFRWFKLDYQANQNFDSLYYMAEQKLWGKGVWEEESWAIEQLSLAVEAGNKKALILLGNLYLGNYGEYFEDLDLARLISYRGIARNINISHLILGISSYEIGKSQYSKGYEAVSFHTFEEAKKHLKKAHSLKYPSAPYYLGLMHRHGYAFPKNDYYFLEYMMKAANRGDKNAQSEIIKALKDAQYKSQSDVSRFLSKYHSSLDKYKAMLN